MRSRLRLLICVVFTSILPLGCLDLIAAAINDAKSKLETQTQEQMKALTAGLPLPPGMKLPF